MPTRQGALYATLVRMALPTLGGDISFAVNPLVRMVRTTHPTLALSNIREFEDNVELTNEVRAQ